MCNYYVGLTANGQTVVYHVADGRPGEQALRDIRRRCQGGSVKAVSRHEAMALTRNVGNETRNTGKDTSGSVPS